MKRILSFLLFSALACAQQNNINGGGNNVNSPVAPPYASVGSLPANCAVGQLATVTSASPGQQLYTCSGSGVWTQQSGGGSGNVTVKASGTQVGSPRGTLDFYNGAGILGVLSDTGSEITITQGVDTAVIESLQTAQSGTPLLCASASGSATAYACSMNPTITAYTSGMVLNWTPDLSGSGGATTLNVDTLGAKSVKEADCSTNPTATDIVAGTMRQVTYNGSVFCFVGPMASAAGGYSTIQNATTPLTQRSTVNFTGTGVSCADNSGATRTDCTITAGGGGGTPVAGAPLWPFGTPGMGSAYIDLLGTANAVPCYMMDVPYPGKLINNVVAYASSNGNGYEAWAFYSLAGALIAQTGTVNADSSVGSPIVYAFSPTLSLAAGSYYMCWTATSNSATFWNSGDSIRLAVLMANQNQTSATYPYFFAAKNSTGTTTLTFPANIAGARTSVSATPNPLPGVGLTY